jgi:CheY-like chemotaxis protein
MTRKSPYILITDDDPEDQEMLVDRFQRRNPGIGVECLPNGHDALNYLRNCPLAELPLLMVIDYKMPGLTGADVLKSIRDDDRYKNIPKIIWSTSNNSEYIDKCMQNGADKYFAKPSDMTGFDRMIDYLTHLFDTKK